MKKEYSDYSLDTQEKLKEEPKVVIEPPKRTASWTAIRSMVDAHVKVTGAVTGKLYEFVRAGAVVNVDRQDANEILNKKRGKTCCGTGTDKRLFELA